MTASFPLLQCLADSAPFALGQQISLSHAFVIGRAPTSAMVLPAPASRSQCIIEFRYQRWWLRDIGSADGVFHNGIRLNPDVELHHADIIELTPGLPFVFLLHAPLPEARNEALEADIAATPDDSARWQVYADWLLEHQNPLGEDMVRGYPAPARLGPTLGALAMLHGEGACEIDWRFGLPADVVIRNPDVLAPIFTPQHIAELMCTTPSFRFIRSLEFDVRSFGSGALVDGAVEAVLETLAKGRWPMLNTLHFGAMARTELQRRQQVLFDAFKLTTPSLSTVQPFRMAENPSLEVLTVPEGVTLNVPMHVRVPLDSQRASLIGSIDECLIVARGEPVSRLALQFESELDRWWVTDLAARRTDEATLKINERFGARAQLRGGDLLELVPGLRVQFHLPLR